MSRISDCGFGIADRGTPDGKCKIRVPNFEIRNEKGFTLIEIFLAVTILSVIMALIYGSFATAQKNLKRAEEVRDEADLARTLLSKMADDLSNAYYNPAMIVPLSTTKANVNLTILYGKKEEVEQGDMKVRRDSLDLTTLTNYFERTPDSKESELLEAGYFFREKPDGSGYALFRSEKPEVGPDTPPLEGGDEYEISDRVRSLQVRYYNGTSWLDAWDTRTTGSLPKLVEVALTLDSGKLYVTEVDVLKQ